MHLLNAHRQGESVGRLGPLAALPRRSALETMANLPAPGIAEPAAGQHPGDVPAATWAGGIPDVRRTRSGTSERGPPASAKIRTPGRGTGQLAYCLT